MRIGIELMRKYPVLSGSHLFLLVGEQASCRRGMVGNTKLDTAGHVGGGLSHLSVR
jgi:hypothetical protein